MLHDFRSVSESDCNVAKCSDGVIWDQMGVPGRETSFIFTVAIHQCQGPENVHSECKSTIEILLVQPEMPLTCHSPVKCTDGWTDWPEMPPLSHGPWSDQLSDI